MTATAARGVAPGTVPAPRGTRAPAAPEAPAAAKKIKLPRDLDPRNPNVRLAALLGVLRPEGDAGHGPPGNPDPLPSVPTTEASRAPPDRG